jgi:two-component SAPR family response regulator
MEITTPNKKSNLKKLYLDAEKDYLLDQVNTSLKKVYKEHLGNFIDYTSRHDKKPGYIDRCISLYTKYLTVAELTEQVKIKAFLKFLQTVKPLVKGVL